MNKCICQLVGTSDFKMVNHGFSYFYFEQVILVIWSHMDPGWGRTYDEYQVQLVDNIYNGLLERSKVHTNLTFFTPEMIFFSKYYEKQVSTLITANNEDPSIECNL